MCVLKKNLENEKKKRNRMKKQNLQNDKEFLDLLRNSPTP
jgi:hypothetical protein